MGGFKWWEKTVEYKFVADAAQNQKMDFAAPLSGRHERSGADAIFGQMERLVLVEFKATQANVKTEKTLFGDYEEAQKALGGFKHHFVVYGELEVGPPLALSLRAHRYFIPEKVGPALALLKHGATREVFDQYLELLAAHKYVDGRGEGKSGHVTPALMSAVIGVSAEGKIIGVTSLKDYAPILAPTLAPEPTSVPSRTQSLRGPGF